MSRKMRPVILSIIMCVVVVPTLFTTEFTLISDEEKKPEVSSEKLTICHSARIDTLILVANELGYFSENGIDVTLIKFATGGSALNGILNGECNMAA